jgi:hypothetical protein
MSVSISAFSDYIWEFAMLSYILALFSVFELSRAATVTAEDQAITTLSSVQVRSFKPYSIYAAAAYCPPSMTLSWSCGGP